MACSLGLEPRLSGSKPGFLPLEDKQIWRKAEYSKSKPLSSLRLAGAPDTLSVNLPWCPLFDSNKH